VDHARGIRVATDFIIDAGASPTSFGLLSLRLGSDLQTVVVPNVPSGVYFVRVRGLNATLQAASALERLAL